MALCCQALLGPAPAPAAQPILSRPATSVAPYRVTHDVVQLSDPADAIEYQVLDVPAPSGQIPFGADFPDAFGAPWSWQLLPEGLIYRSYLAGVKEPRLSVVPFYERHQGWLIDGTIGARVGLIRYGTESDIRPEGWQLDLEAAAFPRLDPQQDMDLVSTDYRVGVPFTFGAGPYQVKLAYYHLSSHLGDEYLLKNPGARRINFSRDALVLGNSYYVTPDLRLYGEAGWAFYSDGGSEPWEFQFGLDYSPLLPLFCRGAPFVALNAHLREELSFNGNFVAQLGWQWRGKYTERVLRTGFQYLTGKSSQYEFFDQNEEQFGWGLWYDF